MKTKQKYLYGHKTCIGEIYILKIKAKERIKKITDSRQWATRGLCINFRFVTKILYSFSHIYIYLYTYIYSMPVCNYFNFVLIECPKAKSCFDIYIYIYIYVDIINNK
jgi:hypothetical protein